MDKNTWKEIALLLLLILVIIITLEIGTPTLIADFWDAIRHLFGITLTILSLA